MTTETDALKALIEARAECKERRTPAEVTLADIRAGNRFMELASQTIATHGPAILARLEWLEKVAEAARRVMAACAEADAAEELYGDNAMRHDECLHEMYAARAELRALLDAEPKEAQRAK
jgi:hypothetical protein